MLGIITQVMQAGVMQDTSWSVYGHQLWRFWS